MQDYSGSTVGTVAPARAAILPAVAYTCKASLYATSFPLTNATLSSRSSNGLHDVRPSQKVSHCLHAVCAESHDDLSGYYRPLALPYDLV
jgi:hypothetical protein